MRHLAAALLFMTLTACQGAEPPPSSPARGTGDPLQVEYSAEQFSTEGCADVTDSAEPTLDTHLAYCIARQPDSRFYVGFNLNDSAESEAEARRCAKARVMAAGGRIALGQDLPWFFAAEVPAREVVSLSSRAEFSYTEILASVPRDGEGPPPDHYGDDARR
jgi:hypothetical protein